MPMTEHEAVAANEYIAPLAEILSPLVMKQASFDQGAFASVL